MRTLFVTVAAVATLAAGQAQACVANYANPFIAEGRVRKAGGEWRDITIEASFFNVRVEAEDPRTPWGRLALTGNFNGKATVFSVATDGSVPLNARVAWKTSVDEALPEVGLSSVIISAVSPIVHNVRDGPYKVNGFDCYYPAFEADLRMRGKGPWRRDMCLTLQGVPVFLNDASGRRIFELRKVDFRDIPSSRFEPPRGWATTDKMPAYLTEWGCGSKRVPAKRGR